MTRHASILCEPTSSESTQLRHQKVRKLTSKVSDDVLYDLKLTSPTNSQKQPRTQMKAIVLQTRARRPWRMRKVPGRNSRKHVCSLMKVELLMQLDCPDAPQQRRTLMKAMPVLHPRTRRPCRIRKVPGRKSAKHVCSFFKNMPASLLDRFYQTCTRPLPTLGQSETCGNMPASLPERKRASITSRAFFIKHAQSLFPRWAKAKHAKTCQHRFQNACMKHAQGLFPRWAKAKHAKTCQHRF